MTTETRRTRLDRYRTGREPAVELLSVEQIELPDPTDGQVLVHNTHLQLTAVVADLMREDPGLPMPSFRIGGPLWGPGVGEVTESRDARLPVGSAVLHRAGWQEHVVGDADQFTLLGADLPAPYYALNQGLTAYVGMVDVAAVGPGDVVFVSGAAGGVGCMAGQIAKARGAATVIGSAGGAEKGRWLRDELGYDIALDYRTDDFQTHLRDAAPDGINVFFDLVGGRQFEAAVQVATDHARFALCGALAGQLGDSDGAHPRLDLMTAIVKSLTLDAFAAHHTPQQLSAWRTHYAQWLAEGNITYPHTVIDGGLDVAAETLDDLLAGHHRGNVLIRL